MIEETEEEEDLYSDIAEVEYEYDEEYYEDDEESEARSVPTDPLGILFSYECCVVSWCLCLLYNIIFIARSRNPLLHKSAQSLRQESSVGVGSVRVVGIVCSVFPRLFYLFFLFNFRSFMIYC